MAKHFFMGLAAICGLLLMTTTGCRDQYEEMRQQCAANNAKTVDYLACVKKVNDQEAADQEDADDTALITTTILSASIATQASY